MPIIKSRSYVIGADEAAFNLKETIKKFLDKNNIKYEDVGVNTATDEIVYPQIAKRVVYKIKESNYSKNGILICGTGIGMAITANKFPGIYAAACYDVYAAERARLSNDSNIITLGARIIGPVLAKKILTKWLSLEFEGGRSVSKINEIKEYERMNFKKTKHIRNVM